MSRYAPQDMPSVWSFPNAAGTGGLKLRARLIRTYGGPTNLGVDREDALVLGNFDLTVGSGSVLAGVPYTYRISSGGTPPKFNDVIYLEFVKMDTGTHANIKNVTVTLRFRRVPTVKVQDFQSMEDRR